MRIVLYPFMFLAGFGFALSVAAHIGALLEARFPGGKSAWLLHVGIFVVWLPTILLTISLTRDVPRREVWKVVLAGCPVWMRRTFYVICAYAMVNFVHFAVTNAHKPKSKVEVPASIVRGFSGHWMAFYGAAFAILYSTIHRADSDLLRRCPHGHGVSPTARFCAECGHALLDESGHP